MVGERTKVGIALGVAGACATTAIVVALSEPGPLFGRDVPRQGSLVQVCSGALVALTYDATHVPARARLLVGDPQQRTWRIRLPYGVEDLAGVNTSTGQVITGDDSTFLVGADVRPSPRDGWCRASVDLTPNGGIVF